MQQANFKRKTPMKRTLFRKPIKRKKKPLSKLAKRKQNPNSKYYKKRADAAWSKVVRRVGKCEKCGRTQNLQAHHFIRRDVLHLRHVVENGICLCSHCHANDKMNSAHGSPLNFYEWLADVKPKRMAWVEAHRHEQKPLERETYAEALERLARMIECTKCVL
ncbi:MAG: hypothetical protein DRP45_11825 [Candidatus Zixiibacteriota bacterium]|nr:MAG: hypothetical protein DRP45_11825 [candidate division Zixibacteria bacterium]